MANPARFSAAEMFDLAIRVEQNGRAFYEAATVAATDPQVKELMANLASAEKEHEETFRRLRVGASTEAPQSYPGELEDYMDALLRSRVLPDEETALRRVKEMDDMAALDFAIAFEKDTILLQVEMRQLVPEAEAARVEVLIQQERIHIRLLQQLKDSRS